MDQGADASDSAPTIVGSGHGPNAWGSASSSSGAALPAEVAAAAGDPRRRIGRYALVRELGRGGMGVVWRAYDTALRRHVALKTLLDRPSAEELRRFAVEVKATARLQHPNIVGVLDVGEYDGRAWYVMELIDGESFEALLRRGAPSPIRVAEIVRDVARGLAHAHERGIVHRDVKPDNILIDREGRVRLADLGLARDGAASQQLTKTGQMLGTPSYMAPEQAGGEGPVGPACDVYALGGVLYRALAGRPPFSAPSVFALLKQVLFDPAVPVRQLDPSAPPELDLLALHCLSKAPAQRPPSAQAVVGSLEEFLKARRRADAPASPRPRRPRALRRSAWAPAAAAVGAFLALGVVAMLTTRGEAPAPTAGPAPEVGTPAQMDLPAVTPTPEDPGAAPTPAPPALASLRARWDFAGQDPFLDVVTGNLARGEHVQLQPDGLVFSGVGGGLVLSPTVIGAIPAGAVALTLRRDGPERCRVLALLDPGVSCTLGLSIDAEGRPNLWVGERSLTSEVAIDPGRFHRLVFAWGPRGCKILIDGTVVARSPDGAQVTSAPVLELGRDANNPHRTGSHMTLRALEVHDADLDDEALRGL